MYVKKKDYEDMQATISAQTIALRNAMGALSVVLIEEPEHKYREFLEQQRDTCKEVLETNRISTL